MNLLLLLRKADEMGINGGLRLLVLSLSFVLLMLMTYYFLVINRSLAPGLPAKPTALQSENSEKQKADAALMSKIKSAIAQTKRLHGYSIGVECKDGLVSLNGDVPSEIDKELAADLAKEISGVKAINNQLRIAPEATPLPGENKAPDFSINVDDLELQANLRERIRSVPELKTQNIEIKVQNRAVTLTGNVASEQQRTRIEQLLHNFPKVTSVNNLVRIGGVAPPPPKTEKTASPTPAKPTPIASKQDQELMQLALASLRANHAEFSEVNAFKVACQNGEVTLSGTVSIRAERALAERLVKEVTGVTSVKNFIVVGVK